MTRLLLVAALAVFPALANAQTQRQLDTSVRFGAIATVGPLCGLRDGQWAVDLRRAELQAMGADIGPGPVDPERQRLHDRAGAALSYAEDEALEDFASEAPDATCTPLAKDPDLARADQMVAAYRSGAGQPLW